MQRGEFDNLPGEGKPLDLRDYFNTPEEFRMAFSLLMDAGVLPEELEILKSIEALKAELAACSEGDLRKNLQKKYNDLVLNLNILMEKHRR